MRFAVRREKWKYTEPCASGTPPSKAPDTYQARNRTGFQPNSVTRLSVSVPSP